MDYLKKQTKTKTKHHHHLHQQQQMYIFTWDCGNGTFIQLDIIAPSGLRTRLVMFLSVIVSFSVCETIQEDVSPPARSFSFIELQLIFSRKKPFDIKH